MEEEYTNVCLGVHKMDKYDHSTHKHPSDERLARRFVGWGGTMQIARGIKRESCTKKIYSKHQV
jgi:hypothetical protein